MNIPVKGNFKFRNAGQGCFYTGRISVFNRDFNFVYDCGSTKGQKFLESEIHKYKGELALSNNKIDLLVISHFDADHCNYLFQLLDKKIKCEWVVLPYLSPLERVVLAFKNEFHNQGDESYNQFLENPTGFLGDRNVQNIIYITGSEGTDMPAPEGNPPIFPDDNIFFEKIIDRSIKLNETEIIKSSEREEDLVSKGKIKGKVYETEGNSRMFAGFVWEFYFYAKKQESKQIDAFNKRLLEEGLIKSEISFEDFKDIIKSKVNRRRAKKIYNESFKGGINLCSLILMHHPLPNITGFPSDIFYFSRKNFASTVLLGDISLQGYEFPNYFFSFPYCNRYVQIPHHGSDLSWDVKSFFPLNTGPSIIAIINYGVGNTYGHPGENVINDLKNVLKIPIKHSTQFDSYNYFIEGGIKLK